MHLTQTGQFHYLMVMENIFNKMFFASDDFIQLAKDQTANQTYDLGRTSQQN